MILHEVIPSSPDDMDRNSVTDAAQLNSTLEMWLDVWERNRFLFSVAL